MSSLDHAADVHDAHAHRDSPIAASIVAAVLALVFGEAFALLNSGSWEAGVIIALVILLVHSLVMIWVTDRD